MSRLLLLVIFAVWMMADTAARPPGEPRGSDALAFLGVYAALIVAMGAWSRLLARGIGNDNLQSSLKRFNRTMNVARWAIPVWFAVGVFVLGWARLVERGMGPLAPWLTSPPGSHGPSR